MDHRILILFSLFLLCFTGIAGATTYYIDTDASGDYDCDGTDDHIQIQWALDNASSGDTVHLNESTYTINNTLWFNISGITFEGDGQDLTLIQVATNATATVFPQDQYGGVIKLFNTSLILQDFTIDGRRAFQTLPTGLNYMNLIFVNSISENLIIRRLNISEGINDGIRTDEIENITITDNMFVDIHHSSIQSSGYNSTISDNYITVDNNYYLDAGIRIYDAYDSVYANNTIVGKTAPYVVNTGFKIHNFQNKWLYNLTLENNTINSGGHGGILFNSLGSATYTTDKNVVKNIIIQNNIITKTTWLHASTDSGEGCGIKIAGNSVYNNVTIINNLIHESIGSGIYTGNISDDIVIKNNIISDSDKYGIVNLTPITSDYNNLYDSNLSEYANTSQGSNDITSDPLFYNLSANNFHLNSSNGTRAPGEILIDLANMSNWSFNDKIRIQAIDSKGNGEVFYVSPVAGTGTTSITKEIRAITAMCDKKIDKSTGRRMVKI